MKVDKTKKRLLIHVGPHKTGSTAIQKWLHDNKSFLKSKNVAFLHNAETHRAARLLCSQKYDEAEEHLAGISAQISRLDAESVILSQEDFAGELPGRTRTKAIYPRFA